MQNSYIIGISGGSGSGKTTFLKELEAKIPKDSICFISQDHYYKLREEQLVDENGRINFDLPDALNRKQFYEDLLKLQAGNSVEITEYTFNNSKKIAQKIILSPAPIIITEGLFVFHYEEIWNLLDLKIFINSKNKIRKERRLKRDFEERNYSNKSVKYQWKNHVQPAYEQFLKPYKQNVDLIINNNQNFEKGLEILIHHLNTILKK